MHPFQKYLPPHWNDWIRRFALSQSKGRYEEIGASSFRGNVRLSFGDSSHAFFQNAFFIEDENREEVAVITEHCGYHIFPTQNLRIEYYEWTEPRLKFEDALSPEP